MSQLKFYKYAAFGLLVLNVSMLAFFFLTRPGPGRGGPQKPAIEHLGLDDAQHEEFLKFAHQHEDKMIIIEDQQKELLQAYFNTLVIASNTLDLPSTLERLTQLEKQKVELTYQHFSEIKAILKPNQIKDFESFMKHILKRLLPPKRKKKHR